MATIKVYNMKAEETGVMEVSDALFQMDYNEALIHQAVVTRLANERQGTKSTLTRTEVRGGGRKLPKIFLDNCIFFRYDSLKQ